MTVYVDKLPSSGWGRWGGGGHMLGSDLDAYRANEREKRLEAALRAIAETSSEDLMRWKVTPSDTAFRFQKVAREALAVTDPLNESE